MIIFIEIWLRKWKRNIQWDFDPKVYLENSLSDVVHIFWKIDFSKYKA